MSKPEYEKMWRAKMRNNHRCISCGTQDTRTLAGFSRCQKCTDKYDRKPIKSFGKHSDIDSVVKLANDEGISYGLYMAKHLSD